MTILGPWPVKHLPDVVDVLDSRRVPVKATERQARGGSVPYYGATGPTGFIDEALFDEPLVLLGEDGVQFFEPYKSKAYLVDGPAWVNNHAHVLRARPSIDRRFLMHYLNVFDYRGFASGTTRLKLTQAAMRRMTVPVPTLEEQRRIVEIIEEHLSHLDAADASLTLASRRLALLRSSVLEPDWRATSARTPIGSLGTVLTGSTPKQDDAGEQTLPFLTPGDIGHGDQIAHVGRHITPAPDTSVRLITQPAVHVVCVGATLGKVGWTNFGLTMNQQINSVTLSDGAISPRVLAGLLAAPSGQTALRVEVSATTMPILNKSKFSRVPVPKLTAEGAQRAELRLDTSIEEAQRLERTLAESRKRLSALRRAVLAAAFSGRLTITPLDAESLINNPPD